jgi:membrane protein DedA with SNARE-associated domain
MEQTGQYFFEFLKHYGYFGMLPLMIIEGPIVTIFAAMMASLGAFSWPIVLVFSISGDMIGDVLLYGAGYRWGMGFVHRVGKYIGISEKLVLKMENYFLKHGGKTIFAVKSTTGLCWATFVAAGIVKMDFRKFLKYSFLGGLVWSGFLVAMGYFYGYLWREIRQYIKWAGWVITAIAIISFLVITLYKKYQSDRLFRKDS